MLGEVGRWLRDMPPGACLTASVSRLAWEKGWDSTHSRTSDHSDSAEPLTRSKTRAIQTVPFESAAVKSPWNDGAHDGMRSHCELRKLTSSNVSPTRRREQSEPSPAKGRTSLTASRPVASRQTKPVPPQPITSRRSILGAPIKTSTSTAVEALGRR